MRLLRPAVRPGKRRLVAASACAAVIAALATLMAPPGALASQSCSVRVISDWSDNGRIDRTYPAPCYREAMEQLPEDLRSYSTAPDDITRALLDLHHDRGSTRRIAAQPLRVSAMSRNADHGNLISIVSVAGATTAIATAAWLLLRRPRRSR